MKNTLKHILLVGLLAMVATGVVACKDKEDAPSSSSYDKESESSLPSSDTEASSSISSDMEDSSSINSSTEDSSSPGWEEETSFPSTENIYLCHNQTITKQTQYVLIWPEVDGAAEYEITAFDQTFKTAKNSYDFTSYCSLGASVEFSVKAIDAKGEDLDSATTIVEKIEVISSGLTYSLQSDGAYTVYVENANIVRGRLVLPDTYDGKEVTKTVKYRNLKANAIKSVRFPKYLTEIGETTFYNSSFENIVIPEGVTTIGTDAFGYIETLEELSFPNSLTSIGMGAFAGCGIGELFLPKNIAALSDSSFANCQKLEKVIFEEGSQITELPLYVFCGCENLSEINIPDTVKKIGESALDFCDFTQITLPDSLQTIEISAFANNKNLTSIHIPKGVTDLQDGALWSQENAAFTSFTVAEDNLTYKSIDGNVYSKDGTQLIQYALAKPETEFTVPDGVTEIGAYAFANAQNIAKVTLPQGIKEIGYMAFSWSNLAEINFPDGLTTLREDALSHTKLTKLILPDSVKMIEDNAIGWLHLEKFCMSPHLEIFGRQTGLTIDVFEVSEGAELSSRQFAGTKIKKMIFPKRFEASSGSLFGGVLEAAVIPDVLYKGNEEELLQLIADGLLAENAFMGADGIFTPDGDQYSATIYYYSENEPPLNEEGTAYDDNYWHYAEDGVTPIIWEK